MIVVSMALGGERVGGAPPPIFFCDWEVGFRGGVICELCFHSKTVLLVFKSDRIVVGMVFREGGGEGTCEKVGDNEKVSNE